MRSRHLPLLLPLALLLAPTVSAATAPTAGVGEWVDATFDVTQTDLKHLALAGTLDIHQLQIDGVATSARTMAQDYAAGSSAQKSALVSKIETEAQADVDRALAAAFPTASRTVNQAVVDTSSLDPARYNGDAYNPGVRLTISALVVRTAADAGVGTLSDDAVAAAFHAGALVTSSFSLSSQPGYDTTYVIHTPDAPAGLGFASPSAGSVSADGKAWTVPIPNAQNATTKSAAVSVKVRDPAASAPSAESISTSVDLAIGAPQAGKTTLPLTANVTADVRALDLRARFPNALPANVKLDVLSADGLRALHEAGAIPESDLDAASADLLAGVQANLTSALGPGVTATGGFDDDSLHASPSTPFQTDPPVLWKASASGLYTIAGYGAENADLALKIGAVAKFDVTLRQGERATDYTIHAPPGTKFLDAQGAGAKLSPDGKTVALAIPAGAAKDVPVHLSLRSASAPSYSAEKADLGIVVDLKDLDITIGKAVKGDFGALDVDVTVAGKLSVLKVPDDLKAQMGSSISLDYLNADALRLLKERGMLTPENLTKLEDELRKQVADNLQNALGSKVDVTGGLDAATLAPSLVADPPSGEKPVTFTLHTSFKKSLNGGSSGQAAMALYTVSQPFDMPKVQGLDTTYTVILPSGLAVKDLQVTGGAGEKGTAPDGREQFTVTPSSDTAHVNVAMAVTPSFVVAKFWPVLLLAVVLLVLIVGTPIALVVRSRRKKASK